MSGPADEALDDVRVAAPPPPAEVEADAPETEPPGRWWVPILELPNLLPTLAVGPGHVVGRRAAALALTAAIVRPDAPQGWTLAAKRGWAVWNEAGGLAAGYPFDAVLLLPLRALVGAQAWPPVALTVWLWIGGLTAAWLGGRWWGSARASFLCGLAWQIASRAPVEAGANAAAVALLPLAFGLTVRALDRRGFSSVLHLGLVLGALLALPGAALRWYLLAAFPLGALAAREGRLGPLLSMVAGAAGVAVVAALPVVIWQAGAPIEVATSPLPPLPLLPLALWGAWRWRHSTRRVLAPSLLLVAGATSLALSRDAGALVSGLGISLLTAGAGAAWEGASRRGQR